MEDYVECWFKLVEQSCREQDYSEELRDLRQAVRFGDAHAMYILGQMYEYGEGVKKDYKKAKSYYGKAAIRGHVNAMYELGQIHDSCCWHGIRKRCDSQKAKYWYKRAAKKGSIEAKYKLNPYGDYYLYDFGGLAKPARADYENVFLNVYSHQTTNFVKQRDRDLRKKTMENRREVLENKARSGNDEAMYNLGRMFFYGIEAEKNYKTAFKWYERSANEGNVAALYKIGYMYYNGLGVDKDYKNAYSCFLKIAQGTAFKGTIIKRDLYSCFLEHYFRGSPQDTARKEEICLEWVRIKSSDGYLVRTMPVKEPLWTAKRNLGKMCKLGLGVDKNYSKAMKWYLEAAEDDCAEAMYEVGKMHEQGQGTEKNYVSAFNWYLKAAQKYHTDAMYMVGECYFQGRGVVKNYTEAKKWYEQAAFAGNTDAGAKVSMMLKSKAIQEQLYYERRKREERARKMEERERKKNLSTIRICFTYPRPYKPFADLIKERNRYYMERMLRKELERSLVQLLANKLAKDSSTEL